MNALWALAVAPILIVGYLWVLRYVTRPDKVSIHGWREAKDDWTR